MPARSAKRRWGIVGVGLIHEPEPMAKAFERLTRSAFAAQIPFAEGNGFVLGVALRYMGITVSTVRSDAGRLPRM